MFNFPSAPTDGQIYSPAGGSTYVYNLAGGKWEISTAPPVGALPAATTTQVLEGFLTNVAVTPDALAALWEVGPDAEVVGAATVTLKEGGWFRISGTASISDIDFEKPKNGRTAWLRFSGTGGTLVYSATLLLPTFANISIVAGDTACIVQVDGETMMVMAYLRGDGTALVAPDELVGKAGTFYTDLNSVPEGFQHFASAPPNTSTPPAWGGITVSGIQVARSTGTPRKAQLVFDVNNTMGGTFGAKAAIREMGGDGLWSNWVELATESGQIEFPAAQNASSDPNTLDDYEEGTFTPLPTFGGGSTGMTFTTNSGIYTKIGKTVYFTVQITLSAKGTSTGVANIGGLPFTVSGQSQYAALYFTGTSGVGDTHLMARITASANGFVPFKQASGATTQLTDADFTATSQVGVTGFYFV